MEGKPPYGLTRSQGRRCRLQQIYLRIGVETDSTKMERERGVRILKVCLAEIERSRRFAPQIRESLQGMVGLGRNSHACTGQV